MNGTVVFVEVSITQFRRQIFELVNQATEGAEVWVTHKGGRFRVVPEGASRNRLSRLTPLDLINPEWPELEDSSLQEEMVRAWEKDWSKL